MVTSNEDKAALIALENFVLQSTVPVLYDDPNGVDQIGTGTLITLNSRYFLVTAAHLFDERCPGRFAIPKGRTNDDLHSLGPYNLWKATEPEIDIAVLELIEEFTLSYVRSGWRVLGLENIGSASSAGVFVLCGYPSERAWSREGVIGGKPITVFTERIAAPLDLSPRPHPVLDLFFHYGVDAPNIDGDTVVTAHLGGTSGTSVWEYRAPVEGALWVPEQTLRIVGIQSAFWKGRYFRAKSWDMVLKMMREADPSLSTTIDAHVDCSALPPKAR